MTPRGGRSREPGSGCREGFYARKAWTQPVPVIMLTGHASIECLMKAVSLGAFECVAKPVTAKELKRIVKPALNSAKAGGPGFA
jgi:DNA-binding NtrC family response regulator